jgi:muramoyltetrapeptide carboxypeptidase
MAIDAVHKPRRLRSGSRIGIIAPAGSVDRVSVQAGVEAIRAEGFEVECSPNLFAVDGYLAGKAQARAQDLQDFFIRADIDAIFCARGGFGSVQLLPFLNSNLGGHPKIFVGYSDVTTLLNWLCQSCHMVTFHAPMVAMDIARGLSNQSKSHFWQLLDGTLANWKRTLGEAIRPGQAEAAMMGGCLSLLVTSLGTPFEIDTGGKLLFLEDVGEKPYRIERMLTHLKMAGKLEHVAGVVLGDFINCEGEGPRDLKEIVTEIFRDANYPVVMGLPSGHGTENIALPFGVKMRLDAAAAELELLEAPVS